MLVLRVKKWISCFPEGFIRWLILMLADVVAEVTPGTRLTTLMLRLRSKPIVGKSGRNSSEPFSAVVTFVGVFGHAYPSVNANLTKDWREYSEEMGFSNLQFAVADTDFVACSRFHRSCQPQHYFVAQAILPANI